MEMDGANHAVATINERGGVEWGRRGHKVLLRLPLPELLVLGLAFPGGGRLDD